MYRSMIAIVTAPALSIALLGAFAAVTWKTTDITSILVYIGAGLLIGIPITATVGVWMHSQLLHGRYTQWWHYAFAGLLGGFLVAIIVDLLRRSALGIDCRVELIRYEYAQYCSDPHQWLFLLPAVAAPSVLTACLFWLIRRPDKM